MRKIKKNLGQQKNGLPQQHYEADKDLVASTGASYCVKVSSTKLYRVTKDNYYLYIIFFIIEKL